MDRATIKRRRWLTRVLFRIPSANTSIGVVEHTIEILENVAFEHVIEDEINTRTIVNNY